MNNLMHDIKEGFIQRRLPDGGFKVVIIYFGSSYICPSGATKDEKVNPVVQSILCRKYQFGLDPIYCLL